MTPQQLSNLRQEFPVTEKYAYLDHSRLGPLPRSAVAAISASIEAHSREGSPAFKTFLDGAINVRRRYAELIGAQPEEVAIVGDTSTAISTVAKGLRWHTGDSVVLPDFEYPSNVFPWMSLSELGVEVRKVRCPDGRVSVDALLDACDTRTRVIAVSLVQFSNGFRTDIETLSEACHSRRILLVVDGMQAIGALTVDVSKVHIDALATQSFKFLLGPHGVGWLYVRRELAGEIQPLAPGPRTVTPRNSFLDHRFELRPDSGRFESGVPNLHGIAGVGASLEVLNRVGKQAVEDRVLRLADRLYEGVLSRGYRILASRKQQSDRSCIVVFKHDRQDTAACYKRLGDAGVVVTLVEGALRAAPHFYNTEGDIDRLLDALP